MAIKRAQVQVKPKLACKGYVDTVEDAKATEAGDYVMIKLTIKGVGGSRGGRLNLLFRPEWFKDGFDPEPLKKYTPPGKKQGSMHTVYTMHIGGNNSRASYLEGLCGSDEAWVELQAKIDAAFAAGGDLEPEEIGAIIKEHLTGLANQGVVFGYIQSQERRKTEDVDENGRPVYEITENYEIGDGPNTQAIFHWSEDLDKKWQRRSAVAARDPQKTPFLIAYES